MVLAQGVENDMCTSSAVVDIAKDVQLVDSQSLDDVANGDNEVVGTACRDDGIDDDIDVSDDTSRQTATRRWMVM